MVLERDDLKVIETKAQVEYKSATKRSIRLDIKAEDRENERFNLEIQRAERVAKETARSLLALGKFSHEDISQGTGLLLEVVEELAAQKTA